MPTNDITSKSKKIVWVSPLIVDIHLHKTSRLEILRALHKRGHEVLLIASYSSKNNPKELLDVPSLLIPLRYFPAFSQSLYTIILLLILPILFIRSKIDYTIIEPDITVLGMITTLFLPRRIHPKIVLDIRSTPVNLSGFSGLFKSFFFNIAVHLYKKVFDGMTIITEMMKKEVCQAFNIDDHKVGVWTSGVSTDLFNPKNYDSAKIKKAFGLEDKFIILYHGVLNAKRGIPQSVKAIQILNNYPDIILFLLGRNENHDLTQLIRDLKVEKRVILHNSVDYFKIPKYISICDAGLVPLPNLPYWRKQCPLKLLEYLAMEKPVIATDIPANRAILGCCKCGIYVPSADPEELARAISYAYENRRKIKAWGALGRAIVKERYTWGKVAENLESYLLKL